MSSKSHDVVVIRGDGIGPEIVDATLTVLASTGVALDTVDVVAGEAAIAEVGEPLPQATLEAMADVGVTLKAPLISPASTGPIELSFRGRQVRHPSMNPGLRMALELYANERRLKSFPGVGSFAGDMDMVVVRETSEGAYSGLGHRIGDVAAESIRLTTRKATERIMRFSFDLARRTGRRKVTVGHKANVMPEADGFFLEIAEEIALDNSDIIFDELRIDALGAACVSHPADLDVVVLENQYGDVISDVAGAVVGSIGLAPGVNYGDGTAVFEASHGAAPDIAGRGLANPIALVLSAVSMLEHLGEGPAAEAVEGAVTDLLAEGRVLTPDLGGRSSTQEVADELARLVRARAS